jgi:copper oxidase (laccase) domain-containing protein
VNLWSTAGPKAAAEAERVGTRLVKQVDLETTVSRRPPATQRRSREGSSADLNRHDRGRMQAPGVAIGSSVSSRRTLASVNGTPSDPNPRVAERHGVQMAIDALLSWDDGGSERAF